MNRKIFFAISILAIIPIILYISNFWNIPISKCTSDWGAFGSYINISISAISVILIYITYNEQQCSNRIERFEQHFKSMIGTLSELVKLNEKHIENDFKKFDNHFNGVLYDTKDYDIETTKRVCTYYLSQIINNNDNKYTNIFKYLTLTIECVRNEKLLDNKEKHGRILEISCILPESIRTLYFCWLIEQKNRQMLDYCYENNLFETDEPDINMISAITILVCANVHHKSRHVDDEEIDLDGDDHCNETFNETYERFQNEKQRT